MKSKIIFVMLLMFVVLTSTASATSGMAINCYNASTPELATSGIQVIQFDILFRDGRDVAYLKIPKNATVTSAQFTITGVPY